MPRQLGRRSTPSSAHIVAPQRASPRARGYNSRWDKASLTYRTRVGICERCDRNGRVRVPELTDHKMPIAHGGPMFDKGNWWALCRECDAWKQALESYAKKTDQVHMLRFWCDHPEELPRRFQEAQG